MLTGPKFQAKIPSRSGVFDEGGDSYTSSHEGQKANLFSAFNSAYGFMPGSSWHVITKFDRCFYKMRRLFYYKMRQIFITKCVSLQNAIVSLQNATVTKKCDDFITKCDCYYKMWRLLQNGLVQTRIKMKLHLIMQKYHQFSIIFELTKTIKSIYNRCDI